MQTRAIIRSNRERAFTLTEAVVAMLIAGIAIAALVAGFISVPIQAEATSYAVSANALAVQGYETARAAKWDATDEPPWDDLVATNFRPVGMVMDMVKSGGTVIYATNYTTITTLSTNPLLKMIQVDCVYPFKDRRMTNTVIGYRAPESGQQNPEESPPPPSPTLPTPPTSTNSTRSGSGYNWSWGGSTRRRR